MRKRIMTVQLAILSLLSLMALFQLVMSPAWADQPSRIKPSAHAHKASHKTSTPPPQYFIDENGLHHPELPTQDTQLPEESPKPSPEEPTPETPSSPAQPTPHS